MYLPMTLINILCCANFKVAEIQIKMAAEKGQIQNV